MKGGLAEMMLQSNLDWFWKLMVWGGLVCETYIIKTVWFGFLVWVFRFGFRVFQFDFGYRLIMPTLTVWYVRRRVYSREARGRGRGEV